MRKKGCRAHRTQFLYITDIEIRGLGKMVSQLKTLDSKLDDLTPTPGTHREEGKKRHPEAVL